MNVGRMIRVTRQEPATHTHTYIHTCIHTYTTHMHSPLFTLYILSLTGTTRGPQEGERQGVDYNFISIESFQRMEKNGDLLESGTFQGNFYGTPRPQPNPQATSGPTYSRYTYIYIYMIVR